MKKIFFIAFLLLESSLCISAKTNMSAKVDERIEFVTAVYNYVGYQKANTPHYAAYSEELNEYLTPYETLFMSPIVRARLYNLIDYEIMIDQALSSTIKDGKIKFSISEELRNGHQMINYVNLFYVLEQLYVESSFGKFFELHKNFYSDAEEIYNTEVISKLNFDLIENLYGVTSDDMPNVYITMLEGIEGECYVKCNNTIIVGGFATKVTKDGKRELSLYPDYNVYTLLRAVLDVGLSSYLEQESVKLAKQTLQYYSSATLLFYEAGYNPDNIYSAQILNLATLLYVEKTDKSDIANLIVNYKSCGFIWENELWDSLDDFKSNREKYPLFIDYLPLINRRYKQLLLH